MRVVGWAAAAACMLLVACGEQTSAVETRDRAEAPAAEDSGSPAAATAPETAEPAGPVTANRRESVDEKVQRLFDRNGAAFDAATPQAYLAKMQAFVERPPSGTETAERPNGDTLFYQASTNTFAVADRAGTPRTMFKPDDGPTYWAEQKAAAPTFGRRRNAE